VIVSLAVYDFVLIVIGCFILGWLVGATAQRWFGIS